MSSTVQHTTQELCVVDLVHVYLFRMIFVHFGQFIINNCIIVNNCKILTKKEQE